MKIGALTITIPHRFRFAIASKSRAKRPRRMVTSQPRQLNAQRGGVSVWLEARASNAAWARSVPVRVEATHVTGPRRSGQYRQSAPALRSSERLRDQQAVLR